MQIWQKTHGEFNLAGTGNPALLNLPMTAFFASRQCPGTAILAAMDWGLQQARAKATVIGGFHSPLEQSVLKVLLTAKSPAVVVLARPIQGAKLPPEWAEGLAHQHLAVVAALSPSGRLTAERAAQRNLLTAALSHAIVVAHASPGGGLARQVAQWRQETDRPVAILG